MYRVTPLAIIFLLKRSETLTLISPDGNLVPVDGEQCENQLEDCDIINGQAEQRKNAIRDLSTDFENETLNEWSDESKTAVRWKAEDYNSPWEVNNLPVKPSIGNSPTFSISRGEDYKDILFTFDFWLRSTWPKFTNLELCVNENGNEKPILSLSDYSAITNRNWNTISVNPFHDVSPPSEISSLFTIKIDSIQLVFYAYCGTNTEDAVAIDNIRWTDDSSSLTALTKLESLTSPITIVPVPSDTMFLANSTTKSQLII
ncbi:hypothetical protein GHT06_005430 [Daphnia sinensis]|uniref:MAM domain-containing protein n=1 Tax=Daphnia sinensis TaxID=1820382 RepID=A0AAD5KF95_9CRUS|nr:hypothetical protein GHT06_005430 [Daphnia sinensis]